MGVAAARSLLAGRAAPRPSTRCPTSGPTSTGCASRCSATRAPTTRWRWSTAPRRRGRRFVALYGRGGPARPPRWPSAGPASSWPSGPCWLAGASLAEALALLSGLTAVAGRARLRRGAASGRRGAAAGPPGAAGAAGWPGRARPRRRRPARPPRPASTAPGGRRARPRRPPGASRRAASVEQGLARARPPGRPAGPPGSSSARDGRRPRWPGAAPAPGPPGPATRASGGHDGGHRDQGQPAQRRRPGRGRGPRPGVGLASGHVGRGVEALPAVAGEPHLDPGVGVLGLDLVEVGDGVVGARARSRWPPGRGCRGCAASRPARW